MELRLIVVPDGPLSEDALEGAVPHAAEKDLVEAVAQRGVLGRQDPDVVADRHRLRLNREPAYRAMAPLGEHVVQQHGVHAPDHQVAVRVHVIVVRHDAYAMLALGVQQDFVRDGVAERADDSPAEIGE